jgi:hypothetical protein
MLLRISEHTGPHSQLGIAALIVPEGQGEQPEQEEGAT